VIVTKILVVDGDRSIRDALAATFLREQYTPVTTKDAPTAVLATRRENPDLILLDLILAGGNGFDVCRLVREFTKAPIILMTTCGDHADLVLGLEAGADDYIAKPFALRELLARVRAKLRRVDIDKGNYPGEHSVGGCRGIQVDTVRRLVLVNDAPIRLPVRQFDLLAFLIQHLGEVMTRRSLLENVWGHELLGSRAVDVQVAHLRATLARHGIGESIRTVNGIGYSLELPTG